LLTLPFLFYLLRAGTMANGSSPKIEAPTLHLFRSRPGSDLFIISFGILFFELTCIRWLGSMVIFLTFFTNLVLMACFLGMSVGCLAASRKWDLNNAVIPLTVWMVVLSCATLSFYLVYGLVMVDVGGQGSPQQIFFGTEYRPKDPSHFVVPIEVLAGLFLRSRP
jgi:hypothetical protein